jgi:hypothetical protein
MSSIENDSEGKNYVPNLKKMAEAEKEEFQIV